jgi:putative ABC transport system permease protein
MRWFDKTRLRWRSLIRRGRVERELVDELRFHLDQQIEENRASGMTVADAEHAARRAIGRIAQN